MLSFILHMDIRFFQYHFEKTVLALLHSFQKSVDHKCVGLFLNSSVYHRPMCYPYANPTCIWLLYLDNKFRPTGHFHTFSKFKKLTGSQREWGDIWTEVRKSRPIGSCVYSCKPLNLTEVSFKTMEVTVPHFTPQPDCINSCLGLCCAPGRMGMSKS